MNRTKSPVFTTPKSFTAAEHLLLKTKGATDSKFWYTQEEPHKKLIAKFKDDIKNHYYDGQLRRCCYCSAELQHHKGTYDAEHIMDQHGYPQFMFDFSNLAVACKLCNRGKHTDEVVADKVSTTSVPCSSEHYIIVHPHLDEWQEHLEFDRWNRIISKADSSKGKATIKTCKIYHLNSARLADHFLMGRKKAEKYLRNFYAEEDLDKKEAALIVLRKLASEYNLPQAKAVVEAVTDEINRARQEKHPEQ